MSEDTEKLVSVPRPSWGKRIVALILLLVSLALLYYAWWGWQQL